jgi:UDP-N-acetylmuramoyl-L-alanyl-D-glutamate--2,6-diaminopimelate ligase
MKLSYLLQDCPIDSIPSLGPINGIQYDSRAIKAGDIFVAMQGGVHHGLEYAQQAIELGAQLILSDKPASTSFEIPIIVIPKLAEYLPKIAHRMWPLAKHINIIGITGTNGKTSISWMLSHAFEQLGKPSARLGTLGAAFRRSFTKTQLTTGHLFDNYCFLDQVASQEGRYAAMEVSSHALDQNRITGLTVDTAIFTNISRDHLDYHETMDRYLAAKKKLFEFSSLRWVIVGTQSRESSRIIQAAHPGAQVIRYAIEDPSAEVCASNVHCTLEGSTAWVDTPWGSGLLHLNMIGRFQIENALAVLSALCTHAVPFHKALMACTAVPDVPGRLQTIKLPQGGIACIDFAHTPASLERVLLTLKECCPTQKVWCVFGCGGNRDMGKRPIMGKIAEQYADTVIVTSDNPRWEAGDKIANDIVSGMNRMPHIILDRAAAIQYAIDNAQAGDLICIAGRGHETEQEVQGKLLPLNDSDVVNCRLIEKEQAHASA